VGGTKVPSPLQSQPGEESEYELASALVVLLPTILVLVLAVPALMLACARTAAIE
jgi:hypothetical protein